MGLHTSPRPWQAAGGAPRAGWLTRCMAHGISCANLPCTHGISHELTPSAQRSRGLPGTGTEREQPLTHTAAARAARCSRPTPSARPLTDATSTLGSCGGNFFGRQMLRSEQQWQGARSCEREWRAAHVHAPLTSAVDTDCTMAGCDACTMVCCALLSTRLAVATDRALRSWIVLGRLRTTEHCESRRDAGVQHAMCVSVEQDVCVSIFQSVCCQPHATARMAAWRPSPESRDRGLGAAAGPGGGSERDPGESGGESAAR